MITFITDRTEADVLLANSKGTYSADDLNRVEQDVAALVALAQQLDIQFSLTTKTDWALPGDYSAGQWPASSQMQRYLGNVQALCNAFSLSPQLPASMNQLNYIGANNIEEALQLVHNRVLGILNTYNYSGAAYAGEEINL